MKGSCTGSGSDTQTDWRRCSHDDGEAGSDGDDGKKVYNLPVKIDFLRAQEESKKNPGRKFNTFNALPRGAIARDELPEVPADQIVDADAE